MFFQLTEHLKKHIFHLAWSPENLPTVDAIYPLLDFLDRRLQEVNRCLLYGNYIRCLHVIWDTVVLQLKEYADISTVWFMLILWLNISIVIRYKVCVMSSTQELVEIHNMYFTSSKQELVDEICPVFKGMLDPIITSYKTDFKIAWEKHTLIFKHKCFSF